MSLTKRKGMLSRQISIEHKNAYPALDPITQLALGVLALPTTYFRAQVQDEAERKARNFIDVTESFAITNAEAARRMCLLNVSDSISRNDAVACVAQKLLENHLLIDVYTTGGAEYDSYR